MGNVTAAEMRTWVASVAHDVLYPAARRGSPLPVFLRIAAVLALLRAVGLYFFKAAALGPLAGSPICVALANGVALANFGLAFLFWRAGANPAAERSGMYTALLVTGLRGASGTYEVLYLLEGNAAAVSLIDMIACIALFVGMVNALPGALRGAGTENSESRIQNPE